MDRLDLSLPEGIEVEVGLLMASLEDATQEWRQGMEVSAQEAVVWQPAPRMHSIGALILHMVDVESYWIHQVGAGRTRTAEELKELLSDETDQYSVYWPTPPDQPLSWYLDRQDAVRARTWEIVRELNDANHIGCGSNNTGDGEEEFTLRWLLSHIVVHEAYHGGQIVLLSLMHQRVKG